LDCDAYPFANETIKRDVRALPLGGALRIRKYRLPSRSCPCMASVGEMAYPRIPLGKFFQPAFDSDITDKTQSVLGGISYQGRFVVNAAYPCCPRL
jgi:hypothetical protein